MMNDNNSPNIYIHNGNYIEYINGNYIAGDFIQINTIPRPTGFPQNIPRSSTDKFVGRQKELIELSQQLQEEDQVTIAHVEGMGGIGKTELAIAYSLTNLQCNTYSGGICWLFCRDQDIGLQIVSFARNYLGLNPPEDLELLEQVTWCWQRWQKGNTLIVLDDVTDYEKIEDYLPPQSSQFKVLITTRLKLELANPLYLKVLSESESIELLSELIGSEKVNRELDTAQELCKRLGYLPLALQLVGRYVKKRRISLSEELRRLESKGLAHPSTQVPEKKTTWVTGIERGVAAAFELSWEELTESAQELGCLLSLFALAPIPWSLVESSAVGQDREELEDIRIELEDLHLLQVEDSYQFHQLIQEFFRDKQNNLVNSEQQKRNFCSVIVEVAHQIPQSITLKEVKHFTRFIPHFSETTIHYHSYLSNEELTQLFLDIGKFYQGQGLYEKAFPWYQQSLSVAKEFLGEEHIAVASSLSWLGSLYKDQGIYTEAEPLFLKALELYKKILGEEHLEVLSSLNNLASIYSSQGRFEEAEPLLEQTLELRKKSLGNEHSDVAYSLNNLASLYYNQGRYEEAENFYLKALGLNRKLLGEEHSNVASSLNSLALTYTAQERYEEAEPLLKQALELRKTLFGNKHPSVAETLHNLGNLYSDQGKHEEAELFFGKALELRKKLLGNEHPSVAETINNLALLYYAQERYEEAEPLLKQALESRKKLLGDEHPDTAQSINNLAGIYYKQKRYEEAETLLQRSLELSRKHLGEKHPDVASILNNLVSLYSNQGINEKAEYYYLQVLEIGKQFLGEKNSDTKNTRKDLQYLLAHINNHQEAISQKTKKLFDKTQKIPGVKDIKDSEIAAEIDLYRTGQ